MFNRVTSIEIGMQKTRICEVDYKRKTPHVYRCITFETPKNAYEDGYICEVDSLAEALNNKLKEAGFTRTKLIFTVTSTKIASREVSIPYVKEQQVRQIVKANASEYFPVDMKGFIISYSILEKYTAEEEKRLRLLILAAPEAMIRSYYDIAEKLACEVLAVDYIGNSTYQLIKHSGTATQLILQISEQMTFLNILDNGVLSLPKTIPFGLMNLQGEGEAILNQDGSSKSREELTSSLQYLVSSIVRILDYYARNQDKRIQTIGLTGEAGCSVMLRELLQSELGIEVIGINPIQPAMFQKGLTFSENEMEGYITCIGAAVKPIGFLPKDCQARNRKNNYIQNIAFTFSACALISSLLVGTSYVSYRSEAQRNKSLVQGMSNLSAINQIYEDYNLAAKELQKMNAIYSLTASPNEEFLLILSEMEQKLPKEAVVQTMNITENGMILSFRGNSEITAAKTLQQLKTIPGLSQVNTDAITFSEDENGIVTVYYVINCTYGVELLQEDNNGITEENIGS